MSVQAIIRDGDAKALVDYAKQHGPELKQGGLTTSKIRGVFSRVRQIETLRQHEDWAQVRSQLQLLKPRLVYQAAKEKNKNRGINQLRDILTEAIEAVFEGSPQDYEFMIRFDRFIEFFEALLAYHYAAGGN